MRYLRHLGGPVLDFAVSNLRLGNMVDDERLLWKSSNESNGIV